MWRWGSVHNIVGGLGWRWMRFRDVSQAKTITDFILITTFILFHSHCCQSVIDVLNFLIF